MTDKAANKLAHLSNAPINLGALREHARKELIQILDSINGKLALVLDKDLSGPLGLVAEVDLLSRHGVDQYYHLLPDELNTDCTKIIYICRPRMDFMRYIASHILAHKRREPRVQRQYSIYFVPRRTMLCERVLAEQGVLGDVNTGEFALDLIPFDEDVLTMEMKPTYKECFLDNDPTHLFYVAKSLMKLQAVFGIIPNLKGKGHNAHKVIQLLQRLRRESAPASFNNVVPEIDTLILIDRHVDMITPMLSPVTYEGLIDEVFGINNTLLEIDAQIIDSKASGKRKLYLNSGDSIFREVRDTHYRVLGPLLNKKVQYVAETYEKRFEAGKGSISDFHEYLTTEFKAANTDHISLTTHLNVAVHIISNHTKSAKFEKRLDVELAMIEGRDIDQCEEYIEACIAKQEPLLQVYRLLVLLSITHGIKAKKFDWLKHEILQTYGFQQMFTLNNLEKLSLFSKTAKKHIWQSIRKSLRLTLLDTKEKLELQGSKDFHHLHNGYAPLTARIVECASMPGGWKRIEEVLSQLPGKTVEVSQDLPPSLQSRAARMGLSSSSASSSASSSSSSAAAAGEKKLNEEVKTAGSKQPLTLVFFLGGVTYAEISALRFLAQKEGHGRDYMVATTKLINGNSLIDSVCEHLPNNLNKATVGKA